MEYARRREHDLTILDEPNSEPKRQRNERTFSVPTQRQARSFTPRRSQSQNISCAQSQAYSLQVLNFKYCRHKSMDYGINTILLQSNALCPCQR